MTRVITSLEEGVEYAAPILTQLRSIGLGAPTAAGGFIRDLSAGIQPKDLDIFASISRNGLEADLAAAGELLGCVWTPLGGAYAEGLSVFESVYPADSDKLPIQLILTPRNESHPLEFDIGICEQFLFTGEDAVYRSVVANRDIRNMTLTILRTQDSFWTTRNFTNNEHERASLPQFVEHLRRVMAKYPDHTPVMGVNFLSTTWGRAVYEHLVQENIFGDPRTLFPAQGQDAQGDEVRQQDGAEGGRLTGRAIDFAILDDEAGAGALRDTAQVQPRPAGLPESVFDLIARAYANQADTGVPRAI